MPTTRLEGEFYHFVQARYSLLDTITGYRNRFLAISGIVNL